MARIKFIDGLRGVAIILVYLEHWKWGMPKDFIIYHLWLGNLGVEIFFIVSGFLIASVMGKNIIHFYLKRALRIFPVYYSVIIFCILITNQSFSSFIYHLTYTQNIAYLFDAPSPKFTNHFWTLAIEEQFYLASPLILFLRKKNILILSAVIMLFFVYEIIFIEYPVNKWMTYGRILPITGFFGVINGIMIKKGVYNYKYSKYYGMFFITIYFISLIIFDINKNFLLPIFSIGFSFSFQNFLVSSSPTKSILENKYLVKLGNISYSFYAIHIIVISFTVKHSFTNNFITSFFLCIIISTIIHFLIEKPFLLLKKNIFNIKSDP